MALAATPALAHPHVFIDVRMDVRFDETGAIKALDQSWTFDEMYSALLADDMDLDGDRVPDQAEMDSWLVEVMRGLKNYDYYTDLKQDDAKMGVHVTGDLVARFDGVNMEIAFTVEPDERVDPTKDSVAYAIYDPTYYIDILHAEEDDAIRLSGAPDGCAATRIEADPDPSTVELAASLDQTQSAGDTLGAYFAEWVFIECGPVS